MTVGRLRPSALALLAVLAFASCAVGPESEPTAIIDDRVPFGLVDAEAAAPSVPAATTGHVFLVDTDGRLRPVARFDITRGVPAALDALRAPTGSAHLELGLQSPLGDADEQLLRDVTTHNGVASVDLTANFAGLDARTQRLAVAQAVLTLTALPGIGQVTFTMGGEPIGVPTADGSTAAGAVSRDDYRVLLAG